MRVQSLPGAASQARGSAAATRGRKSRRNEPAFSHQVSAKYRRCSAFLYRKTCIFTSLFLLLIFPNIITYLYRTLKWEQNGIHFKIK